MFLCTHKKNMNGLETIYFYMQIQNKSDSNHNINNNSKNDDMCTYTTVLHTTTHKWL